MNPNRFNYILKAKMGLLQLVGLLMVVLFSASSCNEAELFSKSFNDFPDNRWKKTNTLEAKFSISE